MIFALVGYLSGSVLYVRVFARLFKKNDFGCSVDMNELGSFAAITDGVIFHNTLASSDYGFLKHGTFELRPDYFAVWFWNQLMGTTVYDRGNSDTEGVHIYCHSHRDGKKGVVYLVINNSLM